MCPHPDDFKAEKNMDEKISVVVPAYNCGKWLPRCLESLLNQTYQNLEIIVVDDGSQDDTLRRLKAYEDRIILITQENRGVTRARLAGVRKSTGAWIGFMDADDEAEPQMYERLLNNARECSADISHCSHRVIDLDGVSYAPHDTGKKWKQDHIQGLQELLEDVFVEQSLCTKLFKRSLFEGLEGKMDPSIRNNEDMLMNYLLFSMAECSVFEDVCPYHYLLREKSASRGHISEHVLYDPIRVRQFILKDCPEELKNTAREALLRACILSFREISLAEDTVYRSEKKKLQNVLKLEWEKEKTASFKIQLQIFTILHFPRLYRFVCRRLKS